MYLGCGVFVLSLWTAPPGRLGATCRPCPFSGRPTDSGQILHTQDTFPTTCGDNGLRGTPQSCPGKPSGTAGRAGTTGTRKRRIGKRRSRLSPSDFPGIGQSDRIFSTLCTTHNLPLYFVFFSVCVPKRMYTRMDILILSIMDRQKL